MASIFRNYLLVWALLTGSVLAGSKPTLNIGFMIEGEELEGPHTVTQVVVAGKKLWLRKVPMLTQRNIKAFYQFPGADGTLGVALRLDDAGWKNVRETSMRDLGRMLLVVFNGRPVQTMRIDNPTKDDKIVVIWKGLTEADVAQLRKAYPEIKTGPDAAAPEIKDLTPTGTGTAPALPR